jgi:hypothetical protein
LLCSSGFVLSFPYFIGRARVSTTSQACPKVFSIRGARNNCRARSKPSCIVENKQESCDSSPVLSRQPSSERARRRLRYFSWPVGRARTTGRDAWRYFRDERRRESRPEIRGRHSGDDAPVAAAAALDDSLCSGIVVAVPAAPAVSALGGRAPESTPWFVRRRGVVVTVPAGAIAGSRAIVSLPDDGSARDMTVTIAFPPGLSTGQELTVALEV